MYILFDTETTGLDPAKNSILTAYFGIVKREKIIDELNLEIKCDTSKFEVDPYAMKVNKIDLEMHNKKALEPEEAGRKLEEWLKANQVNMKTFPDGKKEKLNPLGQVFDFDVGFISKQILPTWSQYVNRKGFDTSAIGMSLFNFGFIKHPSPSLVDLLSIFNIQHEKSELHNAQVDAYQTFAVFLEMRKLRDRFSNLLKEVGVSPEDFITGKTRF